MATTALTLERIESHRIAQNRTESHKFEAAVLKRSNKRCQVVVATATGECVVVVVAGLTLKWLTEQTLYLLLATLMMMIT